MGGFCSGPFPSSEGVGALGTGLVPSTIKGPGEASELQSLGSCASFLPNPFNDGKCFSKDSCHSERGDFPPSQGRMACLLGAQAQWGGGGVGWGSSHSAAKKAMTGTRRPTCSLSWWPFTELSRPQFPHLENRLWHLSV